MIFFEIPAVAAALTGGEWVALLCAFVAIVFFSFLLLAFSRYKRCPSNRVLVIYGKVGSGNTARCIHGGAAFVLPLVQDFAYLSLEPLQIEIPLSGALSIENIRVSVPSVFTVAIGTTPELMQNAAIRLLGLDMKRIQERLEHIIFGQFRDVIASMKIEDIARHREQFLKNIQLSLEPELNKLGLVLLNVNITDITDESGYIVAIGKKAASQAVQQAMVDVAQQEKLGAGGVADAEREKAIQVANAQKLKEIGLHEAQKDQLVRVAELDRDQKIGEATAQRDQVIRFAELDKEKRVAEQKASLEREAEVAAAEQAKRIAVANANAAAIAGETKAQANVAAAQGELEVRQAEAYRAATTARKQAEAAVEEAANLANAKAALAKAQLVEAEQIAAIEAPAKVEKAKILVDAQAAAEKLQMQARAEANAIFARCEADARGHYEMMSRKAQGLRLLVDACGGADKAFQMLMLEHMDKLAETAATAISNIKFDKIVVWENGSKEGNGTATTNFLQGMVRGLPPMLHVMRDVAGIELPDYFVRMSEQSPSGGGQNGPPVNGAPPSPPGAAAAEEARGENQPPPKAPADAGRSS